RRSFIFARDIPIALRLRQQSLPPDPLLLTIMTEPKMALFHQVNSGRKDKFAAVECSYGKRVGSHIRHHCSIEVSSQHDRPGRPIALDYLVRRKVEAILIAVRDNSEPRLCGFHEFRG